MKYGVAVFLNIDKIYTYSHYEHLEIGQVVVVPVRSNEVVGVVVDNNQNNRSELNEKSIKSIDAILPYVIPKVYVKFAKFVADYYLNAIGMVLKLMVPFSINALLFQEKLTKTQKIDVVDAELSASQILAVDKIVNSHFNEFKTSLLHGITGSGKTEIFLAAAKRKMSSDEKNCQIMILVPEVVLSNELAKKVSMRLGVESFIWHNSVSKSKKLNIYRMALDGKPMAVVGARSAIFIPFKNLKLIIVDEEHDSSFKQSETTIYNARDMAVYLGSCLNIPVILSSATPSIESYCNSKSEKYEYVRLTARYFENAQLPSVEIYDLRREKLTGCLSSYSIKKIHEYLLAKKQILIFVNRRGHTPKILCKACGWKMTCPGCSTWLCYHKHSSELICHYCGYKTYVKNVCEECGEHKLVGIGIGIEKAYEECKELFPDANISILSSDTMNTPSKILKSLEEIKKGEIDIILGTQIVAKGHNFNALSLVIVTCVDAMLYGEDFRSIERAFQTLYQVSGRAGRTGSSKSEVVIQTFCPNEELMKIVKDNNMDRMYEIEIRNRQLLQMPPFRKMASITMSALSENENLAFAKELMNFAPKKEGLKILGPCQPPIFKLRSRYRLRIIIVAREALQDYVRTWISRLRRPNNVKVNIDIDPYDFI